ncbi:hypothetical protein [Corynebacterium sp. HMSC059E07]|uniref:hypothetical protein n=1 Tax=Corynebacterium sp. HMSC059E07 TaxID=1739471 RepID=UPI0008A56338|nr:hypothetical protein [Corynebacterium sp. HMSC059E07]OFP85019.1 hypothetical protein HMPREF2967_03870 [Corynebacterium sp. HMSC059E07]
MKKFAPFLAVLLVGCSSTESAETFTPLTTVSSGTADASSTQSTSPSAAQRDTVFRAIFADTVDSSKVRSQLVDNGKVDRATMRASMKRMGLDLSDSEAQEYGEWVCKWVAPEIRYVLVTEGKPDSLGAKELADYDKLVEDTVSFLAESRQISVTPEQVAHALPQAVLTTCLDEATARTILANPDYF